MIPQVLKSLASVIFPLRGLGRKRADRNEVSDAAAARVGGFGACPRPACQAPPWSMQVVLICGGRGTRLGSLNPNRQPKAMLPIHGAPLVSHLWRRHQALTSVKPIVIHSASDASIPGWARSLEGGATLCPQVVPDGVANAFALAAPHLTGPALFLLGDVILQGGFEDPWPAPPAVGIWSKGSDATLRANFGVRLEGDRVVELIEKPAAGSGLVCGIGAYLLTADHLREFLATPRNPRTGEREITEALRELVRRGRELRALRFSGTYLNVNEPADVAAASRILS
jgi:dTDP-glucose pyrophosphorylase